MSSQFFNLRQKVRLSRSLFTKTAPAYVQFYITSRCNLVCQQCNIIYGDADANEMSLNQIQSMAENMAKIGVCVVLLIGGEPFMRSDIAEIVKAFTDNNIHVRLQTNGLATKKSLEDCVKAGAHDISISLDSLDSFTQNNINGGFDKSWDRAIETVSFINELFPKNGTAFFGTVIMPSNLNHIKNVIKFSSEIGWGVSLVPAHITTVDRPQSFRTFDDSGNCRFSEDIYPSIKNLITDLKKMRSDGYNLYDSDEYLDDIYRFLTNKPIKWRRRNENVCDSPSLYFAVEPNGNIKPCCDFKLNKNIPVYDKEFPRLYEEGLVHKEVYKITRNCAGCMYGSYPEITITARYAKAFVERLFFFNKKTPELKKLSKSELIEIANTIHRNNIKDEY